MPNEPTNRVVVSDINMPFLSMVRFMVKWAIASIPAFLILVVLGVVSWAALAGFISGLGSGFSHKPHDNQAPTSSSSSPSSPTIDPVAAAYVSNVVVRNLSVSKTTLGDDGVFGEVKNVGDRTLKEVEITIYCQ